MSICTTRQKQEIIKNIEEQSPNLKQIFSSDSKKYVQLQENVCELLKLCSKFHITSPAIHLAVLYLSCKLADVYSIIYRTSYTSPELIPQQYFGFIKQKLETEYPGYVIGDFHSKTIEVHYLVDTVAGFKILGDGKLPQVEWKSGNKIVFLS